MRHTLPLAASAVVLTMLCATAPALAAPTQAAPTCAAQPHRQFDFWVGDWTVVRSDNGKYAGHNKVESVLAGCALHEQWTGAGGVQGSSYNTYDASRGVWHQTWVDSTGVLLVLEGRLIDGRMVLEGDQKGADGKTVRNRITWTPLADGKVRQRWETSLDGKQWSVSFDGLYARRDATAGGQMGGGADPMGLRALRSDI